MKRALLAIIIGALYVLHQDFWFWRTANPLVFGFIPVGLFYHASYTIAVSLVLWLLVRQAWPRELEGLDDGEKRRGEWASGRVGDRPVAPSPRRPLDLTEEGGDK